MGEERKKRKALQLWLLKTEPGEWSWEDQCRCRGGVSKWDGVKNRQAQGHLKSMSVGDLCFFYHSGGKSPSVVGVVEVTKPWYEDGEAGAVDVRRVGKMRREVGLREIKAEGERVKSFALVRQPRLSVVPVSDEIWEMICEMGEGYAADEDGGEG